MLTSQFARASALVRLFCSVLLLTVVLCLFTFVLHFVCRFAESLHSEYASQGIDVQVQNPLYVTSKLSKIRKASLTVPSPAAYARAACNAIGYDSQISPFFLHAAQLWAMSLLPRSLLDAQVIGMHKSIRKRALKKAEAEKNGDNTKQQ